MAYAKKTMHCFRQPLKSLNEHITMAEEDKAQAYVYCNVCKENIPLEVSESDLKNASTGLITVVSLHGDPQHAAMVYIDKNLKVRGVEYPSISQAQEKAESTLPHVTAAIDLTEVVSSFGEKREASIQSFAQITAQVIVRNPIYLVHTNKGIGRVVKEQLDSLFTEQKTSVNVTSYDELDSVEGMRPTIFDLHYGTFISKGVTIDTSYFEQLILDAIKEPNGFALLQNELSKLMYSYRRLWELLSAGARKYTLNRLAYLVSIDASLVPLLLSIAENDGIDVESRMQLTKPK